MRRKAIAMAGLAALLLGLGRPARAQGEMRPAEDLSSPELPAATGKAAPHSPLALIFLGQQLPSADVSTVLSTDDNSRLPIVVPPADLLPPPTPLSGPDLLEAHPSQNGPACDPGASLTNTGAVPASPLKPQLGTAPGYLGSGGGGGMGMAFSPVVGIVPISGGYSAADFLNTGVKGQNANLGYFQQNLNFLMPIWQCSTDEFYGDGHVGVESFNTNATLISTQQPFPAELWNVGLGAGYRHLFDNGWIGGGSVSVGSASDQPFHSIREMTVSATGFARMPSGERNAWVFGAAMSSNSQVLPYIPIPFAAYLYNPNKDFQAMIGFPFANVIYRPVENLTLSMNYALLTNFHVRATYHIAKSWSVFAALDFDNENYWLADRPSTNQRFFYYNDRLSAGSQIVFSRNVLLQFSAGYIFNRYYFESTTITSNTDFDRVNVEPGAFLQAHLQVRF